jgi:hypothetical protein
MTKKKLSWVLACVTTLTVAGCDSNHRQSYSAPAPAQIQTANFTHWSKQEVFAKPETALPTESEDLVFNFDGDNNPDAYTDLLPTGT